MEAEGPSPADVFADTRKVTTASGLSPVTSNVVVFPETGGTLGGLVLPVNVIVYAVMTPLGMAGGSHARIAEVAPDGTPFRLSGADGTVRQVDRMGEGSTPPCYLATYVCR